MDTKRPLAPSFMNRLDHYLLKNKPEIWSARTHLVVYYGILFMALLAAIAFVVPDDPRKESPALYWVGFVSLISLIALIGWLIYLLRFNVFKRFGITGPLNRLLTFILYSISIGTFILFCYVEPIVETLRANAKYSDQEIINDIDKVNLALVQLEYDSLNHYWSRDSVLVKESIAKDSDVTNRALTYVDTIVSVPHAPMAEISRENLERRLVTEDSVQKVNDSLYIFYKFPTYALLQTYRLQRDTSLKPLTSFEIYQQRIQNHTPPKNPDLLKRELVAIREKYKWHSDYAYYYFDPLNALERIKERHGLEYISTSMDNILERKHRWSTEHLPVLARLFIYTTLILTLLLFAFRHSTARTFFFSILTAIIVVILTSLMMAFSSYREDTLYKWILFYGALFFCLSLLVFKIKKRMAITGIALNLFLWLVPFVPLCLVADHYAELKYDLNYDYHLNYAVQQQHLFWAEMGGLGLLLVLIGTYFYRGYRIWYAAPEQ